MTACCAGWLYCRPCIALSLVRVSLRLWRCRQVNIKNQNTRIVEKLTNEEIATKTKTGTKFKRA